MQAVNTSSTVEDLCKYVEHQMEFLRKNNSSLYVNQATIDAVRWAVNRIEGMIGN